MENWTIGYGALLGAVGLGGFMATGAQHKTALIPAAFGAVEIGLGLLAKQGRYRGAALTGAAIVAALGMIGAARGIKKLPDVIRGAEVERPAAVVSQSIMASLSAAYLGLRLAS